MFDNNSDMSTVEIVRLEPNCGICSYIWTTVDAAYIAIRNGFVPIINFRDVNYLQFHDSNTIGKVNVWEDYFLQPCGLGLDDVNEHHSVQMRYYGEFDLDSSTNFNRRVMSKIVLRPSLPIRTMTESILSTVNIDKTLGVLVRGTDYRSKRPSNHPVQPELETVIDDIKATAEKYSLDTIYLVTDEEEYIGKIKDSTGLNVIANQHSFVVNHAPVLNSTVMKDMSYDFKKKLNSEYLSNVIVLSKLKYNLLSDTSALNAYHFFKYNENAAVFEKEYKLGKYP